MEAAVRKILSKQDVRDILMKSLSVMPAFMDAQQVERRQREEIATWAPIIKASGFKPT